MITFMWYSFIQQHIILYVPLYILNDKDKQKRLDDVRRTSGPGCIVAPPRMPSTQMPPTGQAPSNSLHDYPYTCFLSSKHLFLPSSPSCSPPSLPLFPCLPLPPHHPNIRNANHNTLHATLPSTGQPAFFHSSLPGHVPPSTRPALATAFPPAIPSALSQGHRPESKSIPLPGRKNGLRQFQRLRMRRLQLSIPPHRLLLWRGPHQINLSP